MNLDEHVLDGSGTQSVDRAASLLIRVGRAGSGGARLSDLVSASGLPKPTVRRVLMALVRAGLLDQDEETRRYHIGPETYVLGTLAGARFGIHATAVDGLSRLSQATGDTSFLSVRRDTQAVCLHREEGSFPIRTHVLQAGDRHPLGVGAGSLAMLAALPDDEVEAVLSTNATLIAERYDSYSPLVLRGLVSRTRAEGHALNPGMLMPGSWGIGVAVRGPDGQVAGALSLAAVENRLSDARRHEVVPILQREAAALETLLKQPSGGSAARPSPSRGRPPRAGALAAARPANRRATS